MRGELKLLMIGVIAVGTPSVTISARSVVNIRKLKVIDYEKKIVEKIYVYKVLLPYKNWYSIMTDNGMVRNNIIIVGKKRLLKVALALILMALLNRMTTIKIFKSSKNEV